MRDGFLAFGKAFEPGAVDEEDVEPVVVIVVEEGDAAAGGFEEVSVLVLATVDGLCVEARLTCYVDEADAERSAGNGRGRSFGRGPRLSVVSRALPQLGGRLGILRDCKGENVVKREDERSGGERGEETAARPSQGSLPQAVCLDWLSKLFVVVPIVIAIAAG